METNETKQERSRRIWDQVPIDTWVKTPNFLPFPIWLAPHTS